MRSCQRSRGELQVRRLEGGEERPLVGRVERHDRRRPRVGGDRVVHREQPAPVLDVFVILIVERELRGVVREDGDVEHIHCACSSQLRPVHQAVRRRGAVEPQPVLDVLAVADANRVCACSKNRAIRAWSPLQVLCFSSAEVQELLCACAFAVSTISCNHVYLVCPSFTRMMKCWPELQTRVRFVRSDAELCFGMRLGKILGEEMQNWRKNEDDEILEVDGIYGLSELPSMATLSEGVMPKGVKTLRTRSTLEVEGGSLESASAALEKSASFRPRGIRMSGPPLNATASRPARAMMSAQETVLGHICSMSDFTELMMSRRLTPKLLSADISPPFPSIMMEPSQPPCKRSQTKFSPQIVGLKSLVAH